ncbi:MAG: DUF4347 domain-containing protein [Myxococcales bacterium]|nr:DUF4347 domain-containing protein [Myxococcales bacterium]
MIYDRTCRGRRGLPGLSHAWITGALLYRGLGRFDATRGVTTWTEALDWLASFGDRPIASIQYWGHGKWGSARVADEALDADALRPGHPYYPRLKAIAARLLPDAASLWWFRTCETLGADAGHDFARRFSELMRARVAGHTYIIGPWQSGLHSLAPGERPTWSAQEGLLEGTAAAPARARWSRRGEPNTIHFLNGALPSGY